MHMGKGIRLLFRKKSIVFFSLKWYRIGLKKSFLDMLFFTLIYFISLNASAHPMTNIIGRNGQEIYRCRPGFHFAEIKEDKELSNTKVAIKAYQLQDIVITIHTFRVAKDKPKITPLNQVERWLEQISQGKKCTYTTQERSRNGYTGLLLTADCQTNSLIAVAMELDSDYRRQLFEEASDKSLEKASDFTIKAQGPKDQIEKYKKEILSFMNSFELIEEFIP